MSGLIASDLRRAYPAPRSRGRRTTDHESGARTALAGVSLTFETGTWTAIMGANGSGKSTLLGALAGATPVDSGRITGSLSDPRGRGVVFQSHALDELLTVRENLMLAASIHGLAPAEAKSSIDHFARTLAVHDRLHDRVGTLSGGLARRVDLARALIVRPSLLLLDEPIGGLDPEARNVLLDTIAEWKRESGATIVMATHLASVAGRAERVVLLHRGRVCGDGAPSTLTDDAGPLAATISTESGEERAEIKRQLEPFSRSVVVASRSLLAAGVTDADAVLSVCPQHGVACRVGPATLADALAYRAALADAKTGGRA